MSLHKFATVPGLTIEPAEDHRDIIIDYINAMEQEGLAGMSEITGIRKEFTPDTELPTNGTVVAVVLNKTCIGFARYRVQPKEAGVAFLSVSNVYIAPAYRGNGYSRKLMVYLRGVAKEHHCNAMVLNATSNNTVAIMGFNEAAKIMVCKL